MAGGVDGVLIEGEREWGRAGEMVGDVEKTEREGGERVDRVERERG